MSRVYEKERKTMVALNKGDPLTVEYQVEANNLASRIVIDKAQDVFPEVLGTGSMLALGEVVAARLMQPLIDESNDELSVGIRVDNYTHTAPTPVGVILTITATYLRAVDEKGRIHQFKLTFSDPGGPVGEYEHTRAIVSKTKLEQKALQRCE